MCAGMSLLSLETSHVPLMVVAGLWGNTGSDHTPPRWFADFKAIKKRLFRTVTAHSVAPVSLYP